MCTGPFAPAIYIYDLLSEDVDIGSYTDGNTSYTFSPELHVDLIRDG